jgi:iron(III) transport system ATP-binding protein
MAELHIEGLTKSYGAHAVLRDVSLTVPSGEVVAILGASGSGKTTLLRLVCGFERPDRGIIRIASRIVAGPGTHVRPERRRIGYVAQEGALFPHLSVAENLVFGLPRAERRLARAEALLDMVGLPAAFAMRPPHALSGGEQQRVALARALAPAPQLVLLDEPFSALDAALRSETREVVSVALAAANATALLVTHDQPEALSMGHRVAVLRDGRIVQVGSPEEVYRRPVDAELARFVGEAVLLPGLAAAGSVTCSLGRLKLVCGMPEGAVDVLLRPEQLLVGNSGAPARVISASFLGDAASVRLQLTHDGAALVARVPGQACPQPGAIVGVSVDGAVVAYRQSPGG